MKVVNVKKNSMWYKIANKSKFEYRLGDPNLDICTFRMLVIRGFLRLIIPTTILTSPYIMVSFIAYQSMMEQGASKLSAIIFSITFLPITLIVFIGLICLIAYINHLIEKAYRNMRDNEVSHEPSVLGNMYSSFRDKYCVPVKIVDKDDES